MIEPAQLFIDHNGIGIFPKELFEQFKVDYSDRHDLLVNRALMSQTLIPTSSNDLRNLDSAESLKEHLFNHSKRYKDIIEIKNIA